MTRSDREDRMGSAGAEGTLRSAKTYSRPSESTRRTSLGGVDAALAGKARRRLGRLAGLIEGDAGGRAATHLVDLIGRRGHVGDERGEATGRRDDANLAVGQARLVKTRGNELAQLAGSVHERRRGHLLGANLEQEVLGICHLGHLPFLASPSVLPATSAR